MPRFRLDILAELARQMHFASPATRARQINAAEALLHDIEPDKAYPPEFVIFRITGYRRRDIDANLLTGLALQHDLGVLIETVSASLDLPTTSLGEPILSIDDVTQRFNVTSKTIQRWRRKGLPARRLLFPDGKRRVGFLLSSVERFIHNNEREIIQSSNFSQVGPAERDQILRRARRLATLGRCSPHEIARRIGRRLNRSPLTILHTIKKHEQEKPNEPILALAPDDLCAARRATILRAHRRGAPLRKIARRLDRPRAEIYRVLLEERLNRLLKKKMRFHDDPLYHQPDAADIIAALAADHALPEPSVESPRPPRDLPPYLAELYRVPLLTPAAERGLFLKLNFHKYQFTLLRRQVNPPTARMRDLNALEAVLRDIIHTRNQIIRANLRLVVNVARRHVRGCLNLMDLISEGNLVLMRAVDGFDVHRNTRFSTYATFALMKGFARDVPRLLAGARNATGDPQRLAELPDQTHADTQRLLADREQVQNLLAILSERERKVLRSHFGLGDAGRPGDPAAPRTYTQLSEQLGVTRQRIRQIEKAALAKLRAAVANH